MLRDVQAVENTSAEDQLWWKDLQALPFYCTLTGSRFMGGATSKSDYDFIVQDSPEARLLLASIGFTVSKLFDGYTDSLTAQVLEHSAAPVQIQLAHDAKVKIAVRDVIASHLFDEHLKASGEERLGLWSALGKTLAFKSRGSR